MEEMTRYSSLLVLQVLYRTSSQTNMNVLNTDKTTAELLLQFNEDYIIEVKATTDGGDGTSSDQILIPRLASRLKLNRYYFVTCLYRVPNQTQKLLYTSHGTERHGSALVWWVITEFAGDTQQLSQLVFAGIESLLMGRKKRINTCMLYGNKVIKRKAINSLHALTHDKLPSSELVNYHVNWY